MLKDIWLKLKYPPIYVGEVVIIETWWWKLLKWLFMRRRYVKRALQENTQRKLTDFR
jgi:hypothetical protein